MATSRKKSKVGEDSRFKMQTISQIVPLAGSVLAIQFGDGSTGIVDFKPTIKKGRLFKQLADASFFSSAKIGARGRSVVWPGDFDFDADALYLKATKSKSAIFATLRKTA
jgi:hypothetical protein